MFLLNPAFPTSSSFFLQNDLPIHPKAHNSALLGRSWDHWSHQFGHPWDLLGLPWSFLGSLLALIGRNFGKWVLQDLSPEAFFMKIDPSRSPKGGILHHMVPKKGALSGLHVALATATECIIQHYQQCRH